MIHRIARRAVVLTVICSAASASAHPPSALVVDQHGNVYFAYWGGTWKRTASGTLSRIHSNDLHFLAIDGLGRFASVAPDGHGSFLRVTPAGSMPALFAFPEYPAAFHTDGALYLAPWAPGRIRLERMLPGGTPAAFVDAAISPRLARTVGRHEGGLLAIASGPRGLVYVSDGASIWTVNAQGQIAPIAEGIKVSECADDLPAELPKPHVRGLAVATNGDVYAAAIGCRAVLRISPSGAMSVVLRAERPWSPSAVAVTNGDLYVIEYDNPLAERPNDGRPRLRKVGRDGQVSTLVVAPTAP
jgi:hypothetical protein